MLASLPPFFIREAQRRCLEVLVHREENVVGRNVAKFRYRRGWTQDELVGKLQLLGCYMTRDILANIETQRCIATDKQIEFFSYVFGVGIGELFPDRKHFNGSMVGLDMEIRTRRPCRRRHPRSPSRLAEEVRK